MLKPLVVPKKVAWAANSEQTTVDNINNQLKSLQSATDKLLLVVAVFLLLMWICVYRITRVVSLQISLIFLLVRDVVSVVAVYRMHKSCLVHRELLTFRNKQSQVIVTLH